MSKQEQILKIDPAYELHFKGPFTEVVSSTIQLHNPIEKKVCFKVKTTAPKRYCVRPNSGIIEPNGSVTVAVMLQPHDSGEKEKSKHKFMVQSFVPSGSTENLDNIWKEASADEIMVSKLKCVFDLVEEQTSEVEPTEKSSEKKEFVSSIDTAEFSSQDEPLPVAKQSNSEKQASVITTETNYDVKTPRLQGEKEDLKEDVRQRSVGLKTNTSPPEELQQALRPAESENQFPPIVYLIVALILGIVIGKFLL